MKNKKRTSIFFQEKISVTDQLQFTKNLSMLLKSGVSLGESLEILERQAQRRGFKKVILGIRKSVENGSSLAQAFEEFYWIFNPFFVNLVRIGEESGTLVDNLDYLAIYLKKTYEFTKKIKNALLYPEIVLFLALFIGAGLTIFVFPKLVDLFTSLDIELPLPTRMLLSVATFMRSYGLFLIPGVIGVSVLLSIAVKISWIKPYWHRLLLKMPLVSAFIQNIELASFCRNMGMMLKSGLPISIALSTQKQASSNAVFSNYIVALKKGVEKGYTLEKTFQKGDFTYVPYFTVKMIGIGEKTGRLDESFLFLSDYYDEEVENAAKNFTTAFDPIILILIGLMVGFIAIAIIMPIYQFTGSVKS